MRRRLVSLAAGLACAACGASRGADDAGCSLGHGGDLSGAPYPTIDAYCLVRMTDAGVTPLPGVVPYTLNTPLFSDDAVKMRTVWMPAGAAASYDPEEVFDFPDGTIFTKSFGLPDDLRKAVPAVSWIETRVLLKRDGGWEGFAYRWNDAQQQATLLTAGEVVPHAMVNLDGGTLTANYLVPSQNQCLQCHENGEVMRPIGPKARQLNGVYAHADGGENQLTRWAEVGFLTGAPPPSEAPRLPVWNDPATGTVEQRARAYLEGNCAHCHNAEGAARVTGLWLESDETEPLRYGVCKEPVAASRGTGGFRFDVVPGHPEESVLIYRIESTEVGGLMPPVERSVVDGPGVALVAGWISGLDGGCE
jgi:uncharacterized repeat protein (TIGR03806 family)